MLGKKNQQTTVWNIIFSFGEEGSTRFDVKCEETICMKWQNLFSDKKKKKIEYTNVSSANFAESMLKVKKKKQVKYILG